MAAGRRAHQRGRSAGPAALRGQRVYFEVGNGPYAAGASSFVGETLQRLGLDNVLASLGPFRRAV